MSKGVDIHCNIHTLERMSKGGKSKGPACRIWFNIVLRFEILRTSIRTSRRRTDRWASDSQTEPYCIRAVAEARNSTTTHGSRAELRWNEDWRLTKSSEGNFTFLHSASGHHPSLYKENVWGDSSGQASVSRMISLIQAVLICLRQSDELATNVSLYTHHPQLKSCLEVYWWNLRDETHFLFPLESPYAINHLTVFLTGQSQWSYTSPTFSNFFLNPLPTIAEWK